MDINSSTHNLSHIINDYSHNAIGNTAPADSAADAAVTQFSALLVNMMIKSMRKTIASDAQEPDNGLQQEFFNDLLFQQYSEILAASDALGVNSIISDSLSR